MNKPAATPASEESDLVARIRGGDEGAFESLYLAHHNELWRFAYSYVALWNLALDENAGPHLGGCANCRGVITINSANGFVTRNVEYYALAHASEFVKPGAHRIASTTNVGGLRSVAFKNADDGSKVLIVLNTATAEVSFAVHFGGKAILYALPAGAVVTLRWT
ncbi:MAG TPA: glycoside hydrolase family 30 beta sandwich domain-containing protein [Gemmatimonadaceae bacterium]